MNGDIVGQALYLSDIQIGFDLEKKPPTKSVYLRFWNFPNFPHVVKNLTLLHHDIVRSLFLYIDFHVERFLKEIFMSESQKNNFRPNCSQVCKKRHLNFNAFSHASTKVKLRNTLAKCFQCVWKCIILWYKNDKFLYYIFVEYAYKWHILQSYRDRGRP